MNSAVNTAESVKTTVWNFDPAHSRLEFAAKHMVIATVRGHFDSYNVSVRTDGDDFLTADIDVTIDTASINTGIADRDAHLKSDDFFNAEKYPQLVFKGKSIKKVDDQNYKLIGDLTIRDITKEIELDVEYGGIISDPWGNTRAGFSLTGSIDRFEYDLKWNALIETGGAVVGKTIKLAGEIELVKQK